MQVSLTYLLKMTTKTNKGGHPWPANIFSLFNFESKGFRHSSMSNLFHCCSRHLENFSLLQIDIAMRFWSVVIIGNIQCFPSYKASLVNYFCLIMKFYYRLSHFATQDIKYISLTIFSSNAFASVVTWSEVPSQMSTFLFLPIWTYGMQFWWNRSSSGFHIFTWLLLSNT